MVFTITTVLFTPLFTLHVFCRFYAIVMNRYYCWNYQSDMIYVEWLLHLKWFFKSQDSMGNQLTGVAPSQILPVEQYLTDVPHFHFIEK